MTIFRWIATETIGSVTYKLRSDGQVVIFDPQNFLTPLEEMFRRYLDAEVLPENAFPEENKNIPEFHQMIHKIRRFGG
jgi:hypothetical protein